MKLRPDLNVRTIMVMRWCCRLVVAGWKNRRIARRLKMSERFMPRMQERWPEAWATAMADAKAAHERRRLIGAETASRRVYRKKPKGLKPEPVVFIAPDTEVVKADPAMHTVVSFFDTYFVPVCLMDAAPETIGTYRKCVQKFAVTMGNPPLREITSLMLSQYRDALKAMKARGKGGKPLSINTVIMYLSNLQTVLDKAGPPVRRSRDAAGYLESPPWVKLPRESLGEAKIVSDENLAACYQAAEFMPRPTGAAKFWRAILVVGRYFGLRARTMFSMEWQHVDFDKRRVILPAALLKGRKLLVLPMPDIVSDHLRTIQRDEGPVFGWRYSREWFRCDFHKLQEIAGVEQFGLHTLRRTAITKLWAKSPAAAQLLAGHGSPIITRMSYVNIEDVLTDAMAGVGSFVERQ